MTHARAKNWFFPDGSNRIEEGFVIMKKGPESLTLFIREMCRKGI